MILADDTQVKIDSVILPGLLKSIEVKGAAQIDEQEVEGQSKKPKQATGYEDAKINIDLILEDGPEQSRIQKLEQIQQLFKRPGQEKPEVHQIISDDTAARGVSQVIFKNLSHKGENKKQQLVVSLEFWEYVATVITATKAAGGTSQAKEEASKSTSSGLTEDYRRYLENRGESPKLSKTPARDTGASNSSTQSALKRARLMPY
ncbi:transcriptional regulator [Hungatella effluvii]|uniref:transcriptional regulator n=1 Tax=Hungatella effluvii TaxID=1096246 RepID=UPI0022E14D0C|nr:transcriptional regulator [Hungatella effluvii]